MKEIKLITLGLIAIFTIGLISCSEQGNISNSEPQGITIQGYPNDRLYTYTHEWLKVNGSLAQVGMTPVVIDIIGEVDDIQRINQGDGERFRGKGLPVGKGTGTATKPTEPAPEKTILNPVGGWVHNWNQPVLDNASIFNADPFGAGWLYYLSQFDPAEFGDLMTAEEYETYVNSLGLE